MATFSTYLSNYGYSAGNGKTYRSQLDKITLAVQADTPFIDRISRAKMDTPTITWFEESIRTGDTTAVNYGETFSGLSDNHKSAPTITQHENFAQQIAKGVSVTDEQETAKKSSVKSMSEMEDQLYTKMIEAKTTLETHCLRNGAGSRGTGNTSTGAATAAPSMTGVFEQLNASVVWYNSSTGGTQTEGTPTNTTIAANDFFNTDSGAAKRDAVRVIDRLAISLYQNGGLMWDGGNNMFVKDASMILLTPNNKYDFDISLDSRENVRRDIGGDGDMLGQMYDTYKSSYGTFKVMPDRFLPGGGGTPGETIAATVAGASRALVFNPQNWALAINKDFYVKDIATLGLSEEKMVSGRFSLLHRNYNVSGSVEQINPLVAS